MLSAAPPIQPRRPTSDEMRDQVISMGFNSTRSAERIEYEEAFFAASNSRPSLDFDAFTVDCTRRGLSVAITHAAFSTFDVDRKGAMSLYEYIMCRAVFAFDADRDNGSPAVGYRIRMLFILYDENGDGALDASELVSFVRDMVSGESHLRRIVTELGIKEDAMVPFAAFRGAVEDGVFSRLFLHSRDIFDHHVSAPTDRQRVTIDARAVLATAVPSATRSMPASVPISGAALNKGFQIDPMMVSDMDWRGVLVPLRSSPQFQIASRVVENTSKIQREYLQRQADGSEAIGDLPDSSWLPNGAALELMLGTSSPLEQLRMCAILAEDCQRIVSAEPMTVEVAPPCKVFGDIHGQFRDLLLLFREFGFPCHRGGDVESISYVFNGDFVDRGAHQIEVVVLLMALKVCYPSRVFLVRGNHEFREINARMEALGSNGFTGACNQRYGPKNGALLFEYFHCAFDYLPLSALVGEKILVIHGGLGDGSFTLSDLKRIRRPLQSDMTSPVVLNALWSDPSDSDAVMDSGVHANHERDGGAGGIKRFDENITQGFCAREGIELIIRAHQFVPEGYRVMHSGRLITVFSARNYFEKIENNGAFLLVALDQQGSLRVRPKTLVRRSPQNVAVASSAVDSGGSGSMGLGALSASAAASEVLLVRHGERLDEVNKHEWNRARRHLSKAYRDRQRCDYSDLHDPHLSARGIAQATEAANTVFAIAAHKGMTVDCVYSSRLTRAIQTAHQIALKFQVPIVVSALLAKSAAAVAKKVDKFDFLTMQELQHFAPGVTLIEDTNHICSADWDHYLVSQIASKRALSVVVAHRESFRDLSVELQRQHNRIPYCGIGSFHLNESKTALNFKNLYSSGGSLVPSSPRSSARKKSRLRK